MTYVYVVMYAHMLVSSDQILYGDASREGEIWGQPHPLTQGTEPMQGVIFSPL